MKRTFIILVILLVMTIPDFLVGEAFPLADMINPGRIIADSEQLYIVDGANVHILSGNDFSVKKKFGRVGEGPGEFMIHPNDPMGIDLVGSRLLVKSKGRISFFSKKGVFDKLVYCGVNAIAAKPLAGGYAGVNRKSENNRNYLTINIYDDQVKFKKEIIRILDDYQPGEGITLLRSPYEYHDIFTVYNHKLFIALDDHFAITVYGPEGERLYTVTHEIEKQKITVPEIYKKRLLQFWKTDPVKKQYYEFLKPFRVVETFPPIRAIRVADGKIYAITYDKGKDGTRCLVFTVKGKFQKNASLPLVERDPMEHYPYVIANGKLYQIVENEEEEWKLRVTKI